MQRGLADLDRRMLAAHATGEAGALVSLYTEAADLAEARGDPVGTGFYLTHAYVFALEAGMAEANALHDRLRDMGREA